MMTQVNDSRCIAHDINSGYSVNGRVDMTQLERRLFPMEFADTRCPFFGVNVGYAAQLRRAAIHSSLSKHACMQT